MQKHKERVENLSQPDQLIKVCTGFLKTVEVGQYFMTKHTEEFSQFTKSVACREYTLPRDEKSTDPRGCIRGNTKIGPVLEVPTSYLQGKHGVEIRSESVNNDNSHSWVRISHGLNKLVTDLIDKKYDDNIRRPILERTWIDIEPGTQIDQAYPVSKRMNTLRHGEIPREEDGAIEFWRLKDDLRNRFEHSQYWSDDVWKNKMAGGGGNKKIFQYSTDPSGQ